MKDVAPPDDLIDGLEEIGGQEPPKFDVSNKIDNEVSFQDLIKMEILSTGLHIICDDEKWDHKHFWIREANHKQWYAISDIVGWWQKRLAKSVGLYEFSYKKVREAVMDVCHNWVVTGLQTSCEIDFTTNSAVEHLWPKARIFTDNCVIILHKDGTYTTVPHDPKFFNLATTGYDYDPAATDTPYTDEVLNHLTRLDARKEFFKFLAYCLIPGNIYKVFGIFQGEGNTCKSSAGRIIALTTGNYSTLNSKALLDKFAISEAMDKNINITDEWSPCKELIDRIKDITGGGHLRAEEKFERGDLKLCMAKLLFITNKEPTIYDDTKATQNRVLILRFINPIKFEDAIGFDIIDAKIKKEAPALLNIALNHYKEIADRYVIPEWSLSDINQTTDNFDAVEAWLRLECEIDPRMADAPIAEALLAPKKMISCAELYQRFRPWAIHAGFQSQSIPNISQFGASLKMKKIKGVRRSYGMAYSLKMKNSVSADLRENFEAEKDDIKRRVKEFAASKYAPHKLKEMVEIME